ncbi:uncharacterized protein LOC113216059 [Frankliniella occidentalis]|uniref:Uncharacterized protein LOC113216059 n=1 Tax=Frankliniella occidentalis TaxID=133901 RepID=A0A6J1TL46_FRAOC|nr:uncharacterized protein LOC113216059 [Frankliniella occidentalis]
MAMSMLTLEQLPDDVIVMVLQHLPVEDVLDCRLVCKRLCGLSLQRDVWRHLSLKDDNPHAGAVLHLAPCLDKLTVTGRVPTLAVTTTSCAVSNLELEDGEAFDDAKYALAVLNQESLGRLKRLVLGIVSPKEMIKADLLFRTVAACAGLDSLSVFYEPPSTTHPIVRGPPASSLTMFRCVVGGNSASFVNAILAGHAATLEEVEIDNADSDLKNTTLADLLAAMPRLHSLRCDSTLSGLEKVAECKTLTDVNIYLWRFRGDLDRVAEFLRRANQLRRVHLQNSTVDSIGKYCTVLVEALVSSRRSLVERLALDAFDDVRPLLRALPSLPALRHLDLDGAEPDDELLMSITPVTAPALRLLEIALVGAGRCPHAWMHGAAVKATLTANPLLHIQLWCNAGHWYAPQECEVCPEYCHRGVEWHAVEKIGLYSHAPEQCPSPEDHNDDVDWQRCFGRRTNVACTWIHL